MCLWTCYSRKRKGWGGFVDVFRLRTGFTFLFAWVFLVIGGGTAVFGQAKRVLIVQSFGGVAPPFTTHSVAFETELAKRMGEPVDLDEVSLDVARYATPESEKAQVEFLRKRQANWQPDLVAPVGSPAGIFVAQHRDELFPKSTPVIYMGMDKRRLPPGALRENAAFVGESFDLPGVVEDILQVAPATTNIAVVIGASPLEQFWKTAIQEEYLRFTNRVSFTWWDHLSFDQMLDRAAKMPQRSFILLVLLMRDANGVTHNSNKALKDLHAVANAPINGLFEYQMGLGIVGGRLYQAALEGEEAARIAAEALHGQAVTNYPPLLIGPRQPAYDWRELRRWNINEANLPPGSLVEFRRPTNWERNKGRYLLVAFVCGGEALLIFFLLANMAKSRRAERSMAEIEARFRRAADSAPVMIWMSDTTKLCTFLNKTWLEFTGRALEQDLGNGWAEGVHPENRAACVRTYEEAFEARREFAMEYRLRTASGDFAWVLVQGVPRYGSNNDFLGYIGTATDITAFKEAEERWRSVVECAPNAMLMIDGDGKIAMVNAQTENLFGYTRAELIGQRAEMLTAAHINGHSSKNGADGANFFRDLLPRVGGGKELFGRRKDGSLVPIQIGVSSVNTSKGKLQLASIIDLTERVAAEAKLRENEQRMMLAAEAAHLGMLVWDAQQPDMWTSPKWNEIHGYGPDEKIRFDQLIERVHPGDRDRVGQLVTNAFTENGSFFLEHRLVLPDGRVRWMSKRGRVEEAPNEGPLRLVAISIDITERKEAEETARDVSGKLITAQEDERRRLARDLHDDLNQRLAMLSVDADLLGRMDHHPDAQPLIEDIAIRVKGLSTEVHKLSYQLHPAKLEQLGLITATSSLCQEQGRRWGVTIDFNYDPIPRDLNQVTALCIYRIVQESLQNMGKHSEATRARVEIRREGDRIKLVITDNGRGFDVAKAARHGGLGLVGMRERVRLAYGEANITSTPGQGTRIEVRAPLVLDEQSSN